MFLWGPLQDKVLLNLIAEVSRGFLQVIQEGSDLDLPDLPEDSYDPSNVNGPDLKNRDLWVEYDQSGLEGGCEVLLVMPPCLQLQQV